MATTTIIYGQLISVKRMNSSYYGNPKFKLTIYTPEETFDINTETDGSIGYSVTNYKVGSWLTFQVSGIKRLAIVGISGVEK